MKTMMMLVILLACSLLVTAPVLAMDFQFGLKGGVNRGQTDLENPPSDQDRSAIAALAGGLVFSFGFGGALGLDTDLLFVRKGVHTEVEYIYDGYTQGETTDWHLDYLTISPMLKLGGKGQSFSPYFLGGFELGILLSAKADELSWNGLPRVEWHNENDMKEYMESLAWAWTVGAGLEIPTDSVSLLIETRYVQGLTNILREENTGAWGEETSQGIYFFGGVRF